MLPLQDALPEGGFGNAIALPLQGQALKKGNSAFVDRNWNAYRDQLGTLNSVKRLTEAEIDSYIEQWQMVPQVKGLDSSGNKEPWKKSGYFNKSGVTGTVKLRIEDRIYIDTTNISSRVQWQIRKMAAFKNKQFFVNLNSGEKNYDTPAVIYLGDDEGNYIILPRGLEESLIGRFRESGIEYTIEDAQTDGRKINVEFLGSFREKQEAAVNALMEHEKGMLHAATAFGKTVIGCALIAKRAVNTLIIVDKTELKDQWLERINQFLAVNEEPPEYKTQKGNIKKRQSPVGELEGGRDKLTGIIDGAMVRSLKKKDKGFHPLLTEYGMVIFDECHHAASDTATEILKEIKARYVYGVSATIQRSDGKGRALEMLIGPVWYRYTSKERTEEMKIPHLVYPRFTRTVELHRMNKTKYGQEAFDLLRDNEVRDTQIIRDVAESVKSGRTPVVLTNYVEHAQKLYEGLKDSADVVVLLIGAANKADRKKEMENLQAVKDNESLILVGTGKLIGEGFDFPRLDTLFIAMPVSGETVVEQYAGRISREYKGKENVLIYDYVDWRIDKFAKMFNKRRTIYKRIGYKICSEMDGNILEKDAIYDIEDYQEVFWNDLENADTDIVISSQRLNSPKVMKLLSVVERRQELGVKVVVVTWGPDYRGYGKSDARMALMESIRKAGIRLLYVEDMCRQYAVIDRRVVWHGSVNFLGKEDIEDNLIRITDKDIAAQLLEETFSGEKELEE